MKASYHTLSTVTTRQYRIYEVLYYPITTLHIGCILSACAIEHTRGSGMTNPLRH